LAPDELAVSAFFPAAAPGCGTAFVEMARRHGDYALAGVGAVVVPARDGGPATVRCGYLSLAETPLVLDLSAAWAAGPDAAAAAAREAVDPGDDIHASADYRRHLAGVLTVRAIRQALDAAGFTQIPIMAYSTKFASALYGPFREAGGSALKGDRKSYQMNPMNRREALRESLLDEQEGADALMVKPAGAYLDIIRDIREASNLPLSAYQVSGEYAMIKFGAQAGAIDEDRVVRESLGAIKRAGADLIFTYFAMDLALAGI
jgi:hypothetical protein